MWLIGPLGSWRCAPARHRSRLPDRDHSVLLSRSIRGKLQDCWFPIDVKYDPGVAGAVRLQRQLSQRPTIQSSRSNGIIIAMRPYALVVLASCLCLVAVACRGRAPMSEPRRDETKYYLIVPEPRKMWVLAPSPYEALMALSDSATASSRAFLKNCIESGRYVTYRSGDVAVPTEQWEGSTLLVRIVEGENRGRAGWIHVSLLEITDESHALLLEWDKQVMIEYARQREAEKRWDEKTRMANQAALEQRNSEHYRPRLIGSGKEIMVATSMDCAQDLQRIISFGKIHGAGVGFRRKLSALAGKGCVVAMASGTALDDPVKKGAFVTFTTYKSRERGVALAENVRWPPR